MFKFLLTILIAFLVTISCNSDSNKNNSNPSKVIATDGSHSLLIFKKEQKIELWFTRDATVLKDSFSFKMLKDLPIGRFKARNENGLILVFFNEHIRKKYTESGFEEIQINAANDPAISLLVSDEDLGKLKAQNLSEVFILPNDFRKTGKLLPCFACPHWMPEIYAQLELSLSEYQ